MQHFKFSLIIIIDIPFYWTYASDILATFHKIDHQNLNIPWSDIKGKFQLKYP